MRKQIKLEIKDYDKVWIVSDLHLNQASGVILNKRGYAAMADHDAFIKNFWHENITKDSLVINLGDITFNDPKGEYFEKVSKWPAKHHFLLWGNHNSGSKDAYRNAMKAVFNDEDGEYYPMQHNNIIFIGNQVEMKLDHKNLVLSHFPLAIHNNCGKGWLHLCGHSHNTFESTRYSTEIGLTCDCGVECALEYSGNTKPFFEWEDIKQIMSKKKFVKKDHHDKKTT